jgi:exosome complex component RRP4
MIKEMTGTQIVVGQNGIVGVKGENEAIAAEAVLTIEKRAHTQGLTDYIKEMINKLLAKKGPPRSEEFKMPSREEGENENDQNGNEQVGQGDEEDEFRPDV